MQSIAKNLQRFDSFITKLANDLSGGDILCLRGDLGSGKTTATKTIARNLGIKDVITSPTFVIMKNYQLPHEINGIKELVHVDAYRLTNFSDANSIGLSEYMNRRDVLVVIEWPENLGQSVPSRAKNIAFEYINQDSRGIVSDF